jgi:hypothetical protein
MDFRDFNAELLSHNRTLKDIARSLSDLSRAFSHTGNTIMAERLGEMYYSLTLEAAKVSAAWSDAVNKQFQEDVSGSFDTIKHLLTPKE